MNRQQILEKMKEILVEELGVSPEKISEDARFIEDLGADSIGVMELVMKLEDEFNISIPDEDIEKIRTVGDAVNYIVEKVGS